MISNVSGFVLNSNGPFYISTTRPTGIKLDNLKEVVFNERLPFNLAVKVRRVGWVEFDFSGWDRTRAVPKPNDGEPIRFDDEWAVTKLRLMVMNVFLSIFYSYYEEIHKTNLSKVIITSKDQITRTSPQNPNMGFGSSSGFSLTSPEPPHGLVTWVIPEVLERTINDFKVILNSGEKFWSLIENLSVAHLNHQNNHFSQSVAISWTATEGILALMWNEKLEIQRKNCKLKESIKRHNKSCKKPYKGFKPRNYTSEVMINVLADFSVINEDQKEKLHSIRSVRNDWIHELKDIDMKESSVSIDIAITLLNLLMPINLSWMANTSWYSG